MKSRMFRRSMSTMRSMPGYCTLTAATRPSVQHGAMHLRQGRRGDRRRLEGREDSAQRPAELALDDVADDLEGLGRHLVLKAREHIDVCVGDDVGAGAEELAGLDQQALVLGGGVVDALGAPAVVLKASGLRPFVAAKVLLDADELIAGENAGQHDAGVEQSTDAGAGGWMHWLVGSRGLRHCIQCRTASRL